MVTKVYAAEYNSCIHESSFGVLSLHQTLLGAEKAMAKHKTRETKRWRRDHDMDVPEYEQWRVREIQVLE